jgi:hypothetical protein
MPHLRLAWQVRDERLDAAAAGGADLTGHLVGARRALAHDGELSAQTGSVPARAPVRCRTWRR